MQLDKNMLSLKIVIGITSLLIKNKDFLFLFEENISPS